MANQKDIKQYLLEGSKPYLKQENRNGEILMLSGVWGSGKTHFWKNDIEETLIAELKEKKKSYVFVSLYGKDSIEELQNEIYQLSYNFSIEESSDVISSVCSVFTKVTNFMPKVSVFGLEIELDKSAQKVEAENIKQQIEKGITQLKDGGVICFDDFERKSSKIDLNDLFGFITNLTEIFKTKTIIITNQEFFKENESEVFSRIKEKSVNKFLLLDPSVDELFETVYREKYSELDEFKEKILEAIKITDEKNARVFIQVLDNCLEYKESVEDEYEIFMLVLITVLFVKYNIIFRMQIYNQRRLSTILPIITNEMPINIIIRMHNAVRRRGGHIFQEEFLDILKKEISTEYDSEDQKATDKLKDDLLYVSKHKDLLYQIYKYCIKNYYVKQNQIEIVNKLCDFVESGILVEENVHK